MAQYLDSIDKFYFPRSTRFPEQFMDDVRALIAMATSEIIEEFSQVLTSSTFALWRLQIVARSVKFRPYLNLSFQDLVANLLSRGRLFESRLA
jgi:hypothetical protein